MTCTAPCYHNMYPCPFVYGLEVCPLTKAKLHSLDFAVTRPWWSYLKHPVLLLLQATA